MTFQERFNDYLQNRFPLWQPSLAPLAPQMISPHILRLPRTLLEQIQSGVRAFEALPLDLFLSDDLKKFIPGNRAILMSYDCHVTAQDEPKLIEINTNASFALIGDVLSDFQKVNHPSFISDLRQDIENEWKLFGFSSPPHMAIVDTDPEQQKLYVEFVLYKNLFESWGWSCEIVDSRELVFENNELRSPSGLKIGFIYNRDTDFYLHDHPALRAAYLSRAACVSPHPREYARFADKQRLIDVSDPRFLKTLPLDRQHALSRFVPQTLDLKNFPDREEIWARRKHLVFKPKNAYGSKAVYRGGSVSKKTFLDNVSDDFVAQEFVPASEVKFSEGEPYKYDLRSYVYDGKVRFTMARLYRGQVTNFHELDGGFAPVEFY